MTNRIANGQWGNIPRRRGMPNQRYMHKRFNMIRPFKKHTKITLKFTMIGSEYDLGLIIPSTILEIINHLSNSFVDEFIFCVHHRIHLTDAIRCSFCRNEFGWNLESKSRLT